MAHLGPAPGTLLCRRFHACPRWWSPTWRASSETQDLMVDARLDVLYRDAMRSWMKLTTKPAWSTLSARCWPSTPCFHHPRTTGQPRLSKQAWALLLRASPTTPPRPPMGPAGNVVWASQMMGAASNHDCWINGWPIRTRGGEGEGGSYHVACYVTRYVSCYIT
jgi:hypothetical protein